MSRRKTSLTSLLALTSTALAATALLAAQPAGAADSTALTALTGQGALGQAEEFVRLANTVRPARCRLRVNPRLARASILHSQDMARRDYFSHTAPAPAPHGATHNDRAANAGYRNGGPGEVITAAGPGAKAAFDSLMGSAPHKAIITDCVYKVAGAGYTSGNAKSKFQHYWTVLFGRI